MAREVKKGVESVPGCQGILLQVPETLSPDILEKIHAPPKPEDVPVLEDVNQLPSYDGILFGVPTRFGSMSQQMKAMWDATGGLWAKNALLGKPGGVFVSTATQGGGQEETVLTTLTQLVHHGKCPAHAILLHDQGIKT